MVEVGEGRVAVDVGDFSQTGLAMILQWMTSGMIEAS